MAQEREKKEASLLDRILNYFNRRAPGNGGSGRGGAAASDEADLGFRWFTLITIPGATSNTPEKFNEQVAQYINTELRGKGVLSFVELYLSEEATQRLYSEMNFEGNREKLLRVINSQLPNSDIDAPKDNLRVGLFPDGVVITPALKRLFGNAFIARHVIPPQVHTPTDDGKIPHDVKQYLIGELEVESQSSEPLGRTTIRALVRNEKSFDSTFRVSVHADFDLMLKAFPNREFCSYPLGINISATIREGMTSRPIQKVTLDIHDTRLLEKWSENNSQTQFSYSLISGRNVITDINHFDGDIVPVEDFTSTPEYSSAVAKNFPVPVNRRIAMKVALNHPVRDEEESRGHVVTYKFLFRFFENALSYSPGVNKLQGTGQFIRSQGETLVMLPPMARDGRTEAQVPVLTLSPESADGRQFIRIKKHPDSELILSLEGIPLTFDGVVVPFEESITVNVAQGGGAQSSSIVVEPMSKVNAERVAVAQRRPERDYVGFVEVNFDRSISLTLNEIILGRGQFLDRRSGVSGTALMLKRPLVQWEMLAGGGEEILYYSTTYGSIVTELTELKETVRLDLVGTYYVYVGDFEFMIYLESTPRTELVLKGR
ncbi:MAG TPA: hypothetical protein VF525_08880 [Pyrinomonadaceae bacterium]|jgi:hypothetical protein